MKLFITSLLILILCSFLPLTFPAHADNHSCTGQADVNELCGESSNPPGKSCCVNDDKSLVCINTTPNSRVKTGPWKCGNCQGAEGDKCDLGSTTTCCMAGLTCVVQSSGNGKCTSNLNTSPVSLQNPCTDKSCPTAIGDVPIDAPGFVNFLFRVLLSLSGGIAISFIIYAGYRLALSQGNPEKVQQSREILTSAIVGLLFIIFSVTILQIIGVDILGLGTKGGDIFFSR